MGGARMNSMPALLFDLNNTVAAATHLTAGIV